MYLADALEYLGEAPDAPQKGSRRATLSPSSALPTSGSIDEALVAAVAAEVSKKLDPRLDRIRKALGLAENQRLATSEHQFLTRDKTYRKGVLSQLMQFASQLPENDPIRRRTMRVGILSGLM